MKIALTVHHFPPNYNAGAEIYVYRLASWLIRHGHQVDVICVESITYQGPGDITSTYDEYNGIPVHRLYFNHRSSPDSFQQSYDNSLIGGWITDYFRENRPDVVHVNGGYLISAAVIRAAKGLGLPVIVTLHDFWFVCPRITLLKPSGKLCTVPEDVTECVWCLATEKRRFRWIEIASKGMAGAVVHPYLASSSTTKTLGIHPDAEQMRRRRQVLLAALKDVDLILAPSEFLRNIFIHQGINSERIAYSRLGLETSHWNTTSEATSRETRELQIGYFGQLASHKGVHLLIEAFNRLSFASRPAHLTIYGDPRPFPEYFAQLEKMANGNTFIEFAGRFDNRNVAELMKNVDIAVVPSIWYENSPIVIMEALTAGTPVITSNVGGMSEFIHHNENGLLFQLGNAQDLAAQIQRLLDEPGLADQLAANTRPVRSIEDEMQQMLLFYGQFIKSDMVTDARGE